VKTVRGRNSVMTSDSGSVILDARE
jgi:hypothetical protein